MPTTASAVSPGSSSGVVPGVQPAAGAVLVVDTDPDLRKLAATWLRLTGFSVRTASDAGAALALLTDGEVGCVVVDHAPDAPAVTADLLDAVRRRHPDCRTVVTSVLDAQDYPAADAALPKPFSRVQLVAAVLPAAPLPGPRAASDVPKATPPR
ncbi:response regulator [Nakamurella deserti]|uniref:response regulator n=1 Tax=Nakamurella deserti TaxID=2164074 RepID=UPI001300AD33|nr:response regulator [Nakamurella deserti]